MGETALRKIQAGREVTPGLAVPATRRVYGNLEPKRDQPRRYAAEERGMLVDKFRANAKLVDASFKLKGDVLFEDFPFYLDMVLCAAPAPVGGAATGYKWEFVPDQVANTLGTNTFEWGDESVAWQAPYSTGDSMAVAIPLDDAITFDMEAFCKEWWPQGLGFAGFTPNVDEHDVESIMGWQVRLFIDPITNPIGTTLISDKFIKADADYKNQNKRKYFGDAGPFFTKMGRGRRQVKVGIEAEASDIAQVTDLMQTNQPGIPPVRRRIRIQAVGSAIPGTTFGVTAGDLPVGVQINAIPTAALTAEVEGGAVLTLGVTGQIVTVLPVGAGVGAVTIPIFPFTPMLDIPTASNLFRAKSIDFDFYGSFAGDVKWGARDTNTTFALELDCVWDDEMQRECAITVVNGQATLAPVELPDDVPAAPTVPVGVGTSPTKARVTYVAPVDDGGREIDGYRVSVYHAADAPIIVVVGNVLAAVIPGLVTGLAYTAKVEAHNIIGYGPQSVATAEWTQP